MVKIDEMWETFSSLTTLEAVRERRQGFQRNVRHFSAWLPEYDPGLSECSQIGPHHAQAYAKKLQEDNLAPSTRYEILKSLKRLFRQLIESQLIPGPNPFDAIRFSKPRVQSHIPYTRDEIELIRSRVTGWKRQVFLGILYTGQRCKDICLLRHTQVDFSLGCIAIPIAKTGKLKVVPLCREMRELILESANQAYGPEYRECVEAGYVFPVPAKKYLTQRDYIGGRFTYFLRKIGIENTTARPPGYSRSVNLKGLHSLRHTLACNLALANAPESVVRNFLGHYSKLATRTYTQYAELEVQRRWLEQSRLFPAEPVPEAPPPEPEPAVPPPSAAFPENIFKDAIM